MANELIIKNGAIIDDSVSIVSGDISSNTNFLNLAANNGVALIGNGGVGGTSTATWEAGTLTLNAPSGAGLLEIRSSNGVVEFTESGGGLQQIEFVGGVGAYTYSLPAATGTIALTSDLGDYLPLAGGTMTGTLTARTLNPAGDNIFNFGSPSNKYANMYANRMYVATELSLGASSYGKFSASIGSGGGISIGGPNSGVNDSMMKLQTELLYKGLIIQDSEIASGTRIDVSAILELNSSTRGFLPPRNPDPGTNIVTPATGLMAYDSTDNELQYYNGTSWVSLTSGGGVSDNIATADLTLTGNRRLFGAFDLVFPQLTGFQVVTDGLNIAGNTNARISFVDAFIEWDSANTLLQIGGSGTYDGVLIGDDATESITFEGSDMSLGSATGDAGAYGINNNVGGSLALQLKTGTTFNSTLEVPEASGTIALTSDLTDMVTAPGSQFNDQIAIFTSDGVIEGDNNIKWNGATFTLNAIDTEPLLDANYTYNSSTGNQQIIRVDITSPTMNGSLEGYSAYSGSGNKGQFKAFSANSSNSVAGSLFSAGLFSTFDGTDNIKYGVRNEFTGSGESTFGVFSNITTASSVSNVGFYCDVSGGTANYLGQFKDGTEGTGKFLKCIDANGFSNWGDITESDISDLRDNAIVQTGVVSTLNSATPVITNASVWQITTTGLSSATLPNGVNGQNLTVYAQSAAAGVTVTPTTASNFTNFRFNAAGECVDLIYDGVIGWVIKGAGFGVSIT